MGPRPIKDELEKPEDLRNVASWPLLQDVRKVALENLPYNFRRARKDSARRVTRSLKDDYCYIQSVIGKYTRVMKVRPQFANGIGPEDMMVSWQAFRRRLYRLSPLTTAEMRFTLALLFHELLEVLRAGYSVRVPDFGIFYAEHTTSLVKRKYNPRTRGVTVYNKPSDWLMVHTTVPKYFPDMYAKHVLAKKEHMRRPYRNYTGTSVAGTLTFWEKTQAKFLHKRQVLRAQQIDLMGYADSVLQKKYKYNTLKAKRLWFKSSRPDGRMYNAVDYTTQAYKDIRAVSEEQDVELPLIKPNVPFLKELKKEAIRSIYSYTRIKDRDMDILEATGRLGEVFGDNEEGLNDYLKRRAFKRQAAEAREEVRCNWNKLLGKNSSQDGDGVSSTTEDNYSEDGED